MHIQLYMPVFLVLPMHIFDFKNSIIAIQLFLDMILNLYLTRFCKSAVISVEYYTVSLTPPALNVLKRLTVESICLKFRKVIKYITSIKYLK